MTALCVSGLGKAFARFHAPPFPMLLHPIGPVVAALQSIRLLTWLHNEHYPVYHRSQFAFTLLLAPLL